MQHLDEHLGYVADPARLEAYGKALTAVVRPGDRVLDLGCGTGVLGLLALQAGASHVTAVDNTSMLEIARETFRRAGRANAVSLVRARSTEMSLAERVDIVVCDQVGHFGFEAGLLESLTDARVRLLRPDGTLVPRRLRLYVAATGARAYPKEVSGWDDEAVPEELRWIRTCAVNSRRAVNIDADHLLSSPAELAILDLTCGSPEHLAFATEVLIDRAGTLGGLGGWFACELAPGVEMTNDPRAETSIRRPQAFLPVERLLPVQVGDRVRVRIHARPSDELIAWTLELLPDGPTLRHSTLEGMPAEMLLRKAREARRPVRLTPSGHAHQIVLGICDGRATAREVEERVLREHPDLLPSPEEIRRLVSRVLQRYAD